MSGDSRVAKTRVADGFSGAPLSGPIPEAGNFHTGKKEVERARQRDLSFKVKFLMVQYCWSDTGIVKRAVVSR